MRRPNFFQFRTEESKVFLRCEGSDCLIVEGSDREFFDKLNHAIGWPAAPAEAQLQDKVTVTQLPSPNDSKLTPQGPGVGAGTLHMDVQFPRY